MNKIIGYKVIKKYPYGFPVNSVIPIVDKDKFAIEEFNDTEFYEPVFENYVQPFNLKDRIDQVTGNSLTCNLDNHTLIGRCLNVITLVENNQWMTSSPPNPNIDSDLLIHELAHRLGQACDEVDKIKDSHTNYQYIIERFVYFLNFLGFKSSLSLKEEFEGKIIVKIVLKIEDEQWEIKNREAAFNKDYDYRKLIDQILFYIVNKLKGAK